MSRHLPPPLSASPEGQSLSSKSPDFPVFTAMLKQALGERVDPGAASFLALLAEDVVVEHPYAAVGPRKLVGKPAVRAHFQSAQSQFTLDKASAQRVYRSNDRGAVIVEFNISGHMLATGAPFQQDCVSIAETSGGLITCYREYWNPLAISG